VFDQTEIIHERDEFGLFPWERTEMLQKYQKYQKVIENASVSPSEFGLRKSKLNALLKFQEKPKRKPKKEKEIKEEKKRKLDEVQSNVEIKTSANKKMK
jgi:hypothetical protein